jgi:hypothetical protein
MFFRKCRSPGVTDLRVAAENKVATFTQTESLRFGPPEYLLRALSECATNLDRFWQSVVVRMKPYGCYFLDPRLVSIEFGPARSVCVDCGAPVTILL